MNKAKQIAKTIFPVIQDYILNTIEWQFHDHYSHLEGDELYEFEQKIHNELIDLFNKLQKFE